MESNDITIRDQRLIEHLQTAWQSFQELTPEHAADISKFIIGLEEPYKNAALNMIAKHMVSTMSLHVLSLMTTFQNNAEQDDILPDECKEALEQVLPRNFRILGDLGKYILIQSLDDLVKLGYITGSLEGLSQTTSAETAQGWIYELANIYSGKLKREHLVAKDFIGGTSGEGEATFTQSTTIKARTSKEVMGGNDITTRHQRLIEHLQNSWQPLQELAPQQLADIPKFLLGLEEPYRNAALNMIAKHMVSVISLHILSLMTTFQNNAEQDDILPEECKETFEQILPKTFRILDDLSNYISVQSLDDLVKLGYITGSLKTLSGATSAGVAEDWLYDLAAMYYRRLKREHLIAKDFMDEAGSEGNELRRLG
jgi:hypothetical protein